MAIAIYCSGKAGCKSAVCIFKDAHAVSCVRQGRLHQAVCRTRQKLSPRDQPVPQSVQLVQEEEVVETPLHYLGAANTHRQ